MSYEFGFDATIQHENVTLETRLIRHDAQLVLVTPIIRKVEKVLGTEVLEYAGRQEVAIISTCNSPKTSEPLSEKHTRI